MATNDNRDTKGTGQNFGTHPGGINPSTPRPAPRVGERNQMSGRQFRLVIRRPRVPGR
jgi:hypothetical protein